MRKDIISLLMSGALALSLGLGGCGGSPEGDASAGSSGTPTTGESAPEQKTDAELILGTWLDSHEQTMTFKQDGTFEIASEKATISGTYKVDEAAHTILVASKAEQTFEYRLVGDDTLELTMDGETESLTRVTEEEVAAKAKQETSAYPAECVDQYGNPTLYAITELSGPDLVGLLEEQGYEWKNDSMEGRFAGKQGVSKGYLQAQDDDDADTWAREAYDQATEPGSVAKMEVKFSVLGYVDTEGDFVPRMDDVVAGIANIEIVKQQAVNDGMTIAVVRDSRGKEYLVAFSWTGYPTIDVIMYTDESLVSGDGEGASIASTWDALTQN